MGSSSGRDAGDRHSTTTSLRSLPRAYGARVKAFVQRSHASERAEDRARHAPFGRPAVTRTEGGHTLAYAALRPPPSGHTVRGRPHGPRTALRVSKGESVRFRFAPPSDRLDQRPQTLAQDEEQH